MGNTWEVQVWKRSGDGISQWHYEQFWQGESALAALWHMVKAKRAGYRCVMLTWR